MAISKASAEWIGTLKEGKGSMKPDHAEMIAFTAGSRFEGKLGSNPEELIGAALAGCFSMALSAGLEKAGASPRSVRTVANVKLEKGSEGFSIVAIELATDVSASGIEEAKFHEVAEATKKTCPVSKALASVGSVTLKATFTPA